MNQIKEFKHKQALSTSKIDSFLECSAKYASRYLFKIPDTGNDGANRGTVCHEIFEILGKNQRHKHHVQAALKNQSCKSDESLWHLIEKYAHKYKVSDAKNLDLIDQFLVTGFEQEFYGPKGTVETHIETEFDIEVEKGPISYRIRGVIDKIEIVKTKSHKWLRLRDFKSSARLFDNEKMEQNNQAIIYQIAISHLFPDLELKGFDFIFLKFKDSPIQSVRLYTKEELHGYEMWLTHLQQQINNFSEANINDNFAALDPFLRMTRCGRDGVKKDGTKAFICSVQKPLDYWVVLDKNGEIRKSAFTANELVAGTDEVIEKKTWGGCPFFYKNGRKLSRSFE